MLTLFTPLQTNILFILLIITIVIVSLFLLVNLKFKNITYKDNTDQPKRYLPFSTDVETSLLEALLYTINIKMVIIHNGEVIHTTISADDIIFSKAISDILPEYELWEYNNIYKKVIRNKLTYVIKLPLPCLKYKGDILILHNNKNKLKLIKDVFI